MDEIRGSGINSQNLGCVLLYIIPCINHDGYGIAAE